MSVSNSAGTNMKLFLEKNHHDLLYTSLNYVHRIVRKIEQTEIINFKISNKKFTASDLFEFQKQFLINSFLLKLMQFQKT